jgi:phage terminase large subunit GpA-like protein
LFIGFVGEDWVRTAVFMASAQIGKSTAVFSIIGWAACEQPGRAFWVMADAQMAAETVNERLLPFLENIEPVRERMPQARSDKTNLLVKFSTMSVHIRGSNSRAKLQSTPVMWLLLDEVRNYRKGALDLVLKRTRAFRKHKTIYISTPDNEGDAMHRAWSQGTQSFLYWPCPHCGHWQPFRFGRDESPIYGPARPRGGFQWEENERTRPNGMWNYAEVAKRIWYECEKCGGVIEEEMKYGLLAKVRRVDMNTSPLPGHVSIHAWVAYVTWVSWADIVLEFLKATDAAKRGDYEPLKAFIRETLGEPWVMRGIRADSKHIEERRGKYARFELVPNPKGVRILTVDRQAECFKYVYRQHLPGGASRLLDYGTFLTFDDIRAYQILHKIKDKAVWIDTGYGASECYRNCLRYGWVATKGDRVESFSQWDPSTKRTIQMPWRARAVDPFLGTTMAGKTTIQLIRFSVPAYKDRLYLFVVNGKGPTWEIFHDVGKDYIAELTHDEVVVENGKRVWIEKGTNDYGDCEIMQLVAADVCRITASERISPEAATAAAGQRENEGLTDSDAAVNGA